MAAIPRRSAAALLSLRSSTAVLRPAARSFSIRAAAVARAGAPAPITHVHGARVAVIQQQQKRSHSGIPEEHKSQIWEFDDVNKLIHSPTLSTMLIDVRDPSELLQTGQIPTAYNIPLRTSPEAFSLPPEEFLSRFGFAKPPPTKELVFYCKAGVRSAAMAELARQAGYTKVGEYRGSWLDWERKGGVTSKGEHSPKQQGNKPEEGWNRMGGIGGG